jgi:hypothetical protein
LAGYLLAAILFLNYQVLFSAAYPADADSRFSRTSK